MATKITTQLGQAVPPAPQHSITIHMPTWENVERFGANLACVVVNFQIAYPRIKPQRDVADVSSALCGQQMPET